MGRIQTNTGLITGLPIGDTVDALMKLAAKPRDLLLQRTQALQNEQLAVSGLSALLLKVKYITDSLGKEGLYDQRKAVSSDPATLSVTLTDPEGAPPPKGSYQFTPLRMAQSQQLLSSGFKSDGDPLGGGKLTFRFGDHVGRTAPLGLLGGGQGVTPGKLRITDRSGASAEIDLSTAQTVEDVLRAINGNSTINVTAVAHGDRLRLVNNTGQAVSNLKVQEVGGGTTAASLGLAGIDLAADVADGQDVIRLYNEMGLDLLNDGSGVHTHLALPDIAYQLRDGTMGTIDLSPIIPGGSENDVETTLADALEVVNSAAPGKLQVEIAADGDRLVLTDLTEGAGAFQVQALYDSEALKDLGLDGPAVDGVIIGRRILAGTATVLLSSLGGGKGFGQLGSLALTDRSGASATVDLSGSETLEEVIDAVNASGLGIAARVNQARNGIELVDTTGASTGHLIVANADATATADKLAIAVNDDVSSVNSGDLHLQVVAHNTRLSVLGGGVGVARGTLTIVDTHGQRATLNLATQDVETVGDVIREINFLGLDVLAEINATGDGILLRDTGHGPGNLSVIEGNTTTAADLHLLGPAAEVDFQGQPTQTIDGTTTYTIELDEGDSLEDLRQAINGLDAGVTATTLFDGSSMPARLALGSDLTGKAGQLVLDTAELGFSFQETVTAQDALLGFGPASTAGMNVLLSSSSNTFENVLSGMSVTIERTSTSPVTVTVSTSDTDLVANVQTMVDNYNQFRDKLKELTAYDQKTDSRSVLTGNPTALRLDSELSYLLSGAFAGAGSIRSLAEVGVRFQDDGTLSFNAAELRAKYAADPEAVAQFFTAEESGVSARFDKLLEQLGGADASLLAQRLRTLNDKIDRNQDRIKFMEDRLDVQRERLLLQFYRMEVAIGKMQSSLSALQAIQPLTPLTTSNSQ
jgi:flagellar hook-associated protein 2